MSIRKSVIAVLITAFILSAVITVPVCAAPEGKNQTAYLNTKTVTKAAVKEELSRYAKPKMIKTFVLGSDVKKISEGAFKGTKIAVIKLDTTKLNKASVKGCLKGSHVSDVEILLTRYDRKTRKKYYNRYKKYFFNKDIVGQTSDKVMGMSMVTGGTKKDDTKYTLDPETKTVIGTKNGKQVSKIIYKDDVMLSDYKVIWCDDTEKGKYALIVKTDGADSTDDEGIATGKTVVFDYLHMSDAIAVKVTDATDNGDGTMTVKGTKPSMFDVFKDVIINS